MALKIPTIITKEWLEKNCLCQRREKRLLCQASCPVHGPFADMTEVQRKAIAETTESMGLRLNWHEDRAQA